MARGKSEGGVKKVSQRAMVQDALDHVGFDSKPAELQAHIKEKYDVDLPPNIISNYKSQIKRQSGQGGTSRTRQASGTLQVQDFAMLRQLVVRLGVDQVKQMVDVVA
jgi:hypothetical protein